MWIHLSEYKNYIPISGDEMLMLPEIIVTKLLTWQL